MPDDLVPKGGIASARLEHLVKELAMPSPFTPGDGSQNNPSAESKYKTSRSKTPEQYLLDDVRRRDPAVSVVHMNGVQTIHIAPDQKHTLFTYGLCGCTAALVLSQKPDGSSIATLTHYDPLHRQISPLILEQEVRQHHGELAKGTERSLIIVSPGVYVESAGGWELKVKDESIVNALINGAQRGLSDSGMNSKVCPYSESLEWGKSSGFIVRFLQGRERINYEAHGDYYGALPLKSSV